MPRRPPRTECADRRRSQSRVTGEDTDLVSRPEQVDFGPEAVGARDEFYGSFEWAGVSADGSAAADASRFDPRGR